MDLWHTSTLCMCIHYADVDVHVKARDWHLVSFPVVLIFRGRVSHWTLDFQIQLDRLASEPQLSSCLHLPSTGYTCAVSAEPSRFTGHLVDWMQAHMLVHESLYYPSHLPSPLSILWGILGVRNCLSSFDTPKFRTVQTRSVPVLAETLPTSW